MLLLRGAREGKRMVKFLRLSLVCVLLPLFGAPLAAMEMRIVVSIPPQIMLVKAILGNNADVTALLAPGADEHTYQPSVRQLTEITRAAIYFSSGLPFEEGLVPKLGGMKSGLKIIDMTRGINRIAESAELDAHPHHDAGGDPHLWLDPLLLKAMGKNICAALSEADSASRVTYEQRFGELSARLDALDSAIRKILAPYKGHRFLVFHPSFGYFAARYNLRQEAIETEGKEPSAAHLHEIVAEAKKERIDTIVIQPQFSDKSAQAIAQALHGKTVSFDTLQPDVIGNLETLAHLLAAAFDHK